MAGFMNWRIPLLARRALTTAPSLIILAPAVNTSQAPVYSQIILSFGIPFALIPLPPITGDAGIMTYMHNGRLRWLTEHGIALGDVLEVRQVRAGGAVSIGAASGVHPLDAHVTAAIRVQAAA
jgi:Natural resistance-associated macrophage protein